MLSFYDEQFFSFVMLQKLLHIDTVVMGYTYTFTLAFIPSKLRISRSKADYSENSVSAQSVLPPPAG